jgi:hypothetical protein
MTNSIKKIWVTPTAHARGDGYQMKKTSPTTSKAIRNEIDKWLRKNFIRLDMSKFYSFYFVKFDSISNLAISSIVSIITHKYFTLIAFDKGLA